MFRKQQTISKTITFAGIGLHSGEKIRVYIHPAQSGGIVFVDTSREDRPEVPARPEFVTDCSRNTTIGSDKTRFLTIEHLMAALWVNGVDHARVEINGHEPPAMDGSAREFANVVFIAGAAELGSDCNPIILREPVMVKMGEDRAWAMPYNGLRVTYVIEYAHPMVGAGVFNMEVTPQSFRAEIAPARTFALDSEVRAIMDSGLAKGGSLENAVVVYDDKYSVPLRFPDEFARHKALDLIGDLALLGRPLMAHVVSIRGGHRLNSELVKAIAAVY